METIAVPLIKKKVRKRKAKSLILSVKAPTRMINKPCHSLRTTRGQRMITQVLNRIRMLQHQLHFLQKHLVMQILPKLPKRMLSVVRRP